MTVQLAAIQKACNSFITHHPEFWILSGLTDVSFETKTGNTRYQRAIATFREGPDGTSFDFAPSLLDELSRCVNSNVVEILRAQNPQFGEIHDDRSWRGMEPDIRWGSGNDETIVEIKAMYECTLLKYYGPKRGKEGSIAKDADKLQSIRRDGFPGHLFQVVFFRHMPNYRYCAGDSFQGDWEPNYCRSDYLIRDDIEAQYQQTRHYLIDEPAWPIHAPAIVPLVLPSHLITPINRWFEAIFRPADSSWRFNPDLQLADAAASCAIWKY